MKTNVTKPQFPTQKKSGMSAWKSIALCMTLILVPWALYVNFHPRFDRPAEPIKKLTPEQEAILSGLANHPEPHPVIKEPEVMKPKPEIPVVKMPEVKPAPVVAKRPKIVIPELPVLGPVVTNGAQPLYGIKHKGTDAIFALACNYPKLYYQRFVGSLRKVGYNEDIVLAVSPEEKMKPGIKEYVKATNIVAYAFDVDCAGTDNCKLKDDFLGYPDPRPHRTFANIRYALYEYWLKHYTENSYILILDFRDTFFQANPFQMFGTYDSRPKDDPQYVLQVFAENHKVKTIGNCVYNSMWVGKCFGKPALEAIKENAVICSGSTLGSFLAVSYYVRTMLASMDTVKCWLKGIESDQGYQSHLFYNGHFNTIMGNATVFQQGYGPVNTIGALNGFRVPKEMKGPLDTHWKIRDKEGYILNYDGTRSACVHQWDRWHDELHAFVDSKLFDKDL